MSLISRNKRSSIWMYFSAIEGKFGKAKCDTCGNMYSYSSGSTTNLASHLRAKHPSLAGNLPKRKNHSMTTSSTSVARTNATASNSGDDIPAAESEIATTAINGDDSAETTNVAAVSAGVANQSSTSMTTAGRTERSTFSQRSLKSFITRPASVARQKRLNELLLKMIAGDLQPFSVVEDSGFREFVTALDPSFAIPSRQMLTRDLLPAKYNQAVESVKKTLMTVEAVSLTTDSWTSICTENYIAVTAHYVTADFTLGSCLLECIKYTERYTGGNLAAELRRVVSEWGLDKKVVAIITDNAANMKAAVESAKFRHLRCFAHTLNLVVQKAVQAINDLKVKVKAIVEYFHRSTMAADKLRSMQLQLRPDKAVLKLKNDVMTRWNSTYFMFNRLCEIQEPLEAAIALLHNPVKQLTADEWLALKEISLVLKPFDAVTTEISAEKSVTVSKVIMLARGLTAACEKIQSKLTNSLSKILMKELLEGLHERFGSCEANALLARATFLDPRFKKKGFNVDLCYNRVFNDITSIIAGQISTTATNEQAQPSSCKYIFCGSLMKL
jgi:zinc finger BED domain-containing protein 1 (E3 SUMO-protein ligase ZBED1)